MKTKQKKRIAFRILIGHYLDLLPPEMIKLFGNAKKKVTNDKKKKKKKKKNW